MKTRPTRYLVVIGSLVVAANSFADTTEPAHYCRKPSKPLQFDDQSEIDSFQDDVRRYKKCLSDFIEEQREGVENHRRAAEDAADEWNRYVKRDFQ